jgi:hypothetical protein
VVTTEGPLVGDALLRPGKQLELWLCGGYE